MKIIRLEDISQIKPFDCGDSDLNEFLLSDAALYQQQFLASTYIIEDDERTIAFYSLLNDKISKSNIPQNLWRKVRKEVVHPILVTTYGLKRNEYSGYFVDTVTFDELFNQ